MPVVDVEKIINYTPAKRIHNQYESLKANYTKEAAKEYLTSYSKEKLSDILENSRYIFSEPYYGLDFYKSIVLNESACIFTRLDDELNKVVDYFNENNNQMIKEQKKLYSDLITAMEAKIAECRNTRIYSEYILENIDDEFETNLSNELYEYMKMESKDDKNLNDLFKIANNGIVYITYAPYVLEYTGNIGSVSNKVSALFDKFVDYSDLNINNESFKSYIEKVIAGNKLSHDDCYIEAVDDILNHNTKDFFKCYINRNPLDDLSNFKYRLESLPITLESATDSVNSLFDDIYINEREEESNINEKAKNNLYDYIVFRSTLDILLEEVSMFDKETIADGYAVVEEKSLSDSIDYIYSLLNENPYYLSEETDFSDDDIADDDEEDNNEDKEKEKPNNSIDKEVSSEEMRDVSKKSLAPTPKNKTTALTNKLMDLENKQFKAYGELKRRGSDAMGAVKALTNLPRNVINDITDTAKKIENWDTDRRINYISKPGYRKKWFKNLKLALLYGTGAQISASMLPITMICRHFSKVKDKRIRDDILVNLEAEINVINAKIADCENSDADREKKYALMRSKAELQKQLVRIKANTATV